MNFKKKLDILADKYFWTPILFLLENPFWAIMLAITLLIGYRFLPTFGENYSSGVREGLLQKYTVKGYIWKTGEGEVVLNSYRFKSNSNGTTGGSDRFYFSDKSKKDYFLLVGKNVRVYYTQAVHRPYSAGDTNYRVDSISVLE